MTDKQVRVRYIQNEIVLEIVVARPLGTEFTKKILPSPSSPLLSTSSPLISSLYREEISGDEVDRSGEEGDGRIFKEK
jgi:hypothetical protein